MSVGMRQRTCIGCGKVSSKQRMFRVARTPQGDAAFDETGRGTGRGAYVCSVACFAEARKKGRFASALRCKVSPEAYVRIEEGLKRAISTEADGCEG